jgi:hypothetical protein
MGPDAGDAGELSGVFSTISGTVDSMETLGNKLVQVTSFNMTVAMIWAVIAFAFFTMIVRLAKPWNDGAAERWRVTGRVLPKVDRDQRIQDLEDKLANALAQLAALTGASASQPQGDGNGS